MADLFFIVPPELAPQDAKAVTHQTPFGPVTEQGTFLLRTEGADPRALIYAAKAAGAGRILAADLVEPVSPLLEEGDLLIPADTIDQTRLRPATFFVGKDYGFIKLNPPFCPELMASLHRAGRALTPRTFQGATYLGTDGPRGATPAERRMFRNWGADVVGSGLLPEAYLARELELCYGAITAVGTADLTGVLRKAAELPHGSRSCTCGQTMTFARSQGLVEEDWRTW